MNKGLQALKRLQGEGRVGIYDETDICQDLEIAEYYLQALDIIKEKFVITAYIRNAETMEEYNKQLKQTTFRKDYERRKLTQEEYQHLKEVFYND